MDANRAPTSHFLRSIIDAVADPIFVKDEGHRLVELNRALCNLMGRPREEILGKTDYEFFPAHEADIFRKKDQEVFNSGRDNINEESITDAHGVTRTISTKKTIFTDREGHKVLVGVIRDITDLREAERRNLEMSQRLAASAKFAALGEMAGGIAHEINTPLAIIMGLADELIDMVEDDELGPEAVTRVHQEIGRTVSRISNIVSGLRAFARDGSKDTPVVVSLDTLIGETMSLCGENLRVNGIDCQILGNAADIAVCCRSTQAVQILLNLLNNARDAVKGTDERRIEVRASADEDYGQVRVIDSGPGIPADIRERVMEPFFTTKPVGSGTGIGLSIARGLAEDNGGMLLLDEDHPQTCFVLQLPREPSSSPSGGRT